MPIEVGRPLTPEEEARMLAEVTIFRDAIVALAEMVDLGEQSDAPAPTEPITVMGEET